MNQPAITEDAYRSLNERYLAYLDALYAPRDMRRRLLLTGAFVGMLLTGLSVYFAITAPTPAIWLLLPLGLALIARCLMALNGIRMAREQYRHLRNVIRHGVPVTGYIVQAHEALYQPGRDTLPCVVLFSFSPEVEQDAGYMHHLAERIFALKNSEQEDPDLKFLAALTTDECPIPYRRRRLPFSFTDGSTIYCADLWVKRAYLKNGMLETSALPCLAEPGEVGGLELIPAWLLNGGEKTVLAYRQE
jgi:hypothetical protein